jgi:hypothetical protein
VHSSVALIYDIYLSSSSTNKKDLTISICFLVYHVFIVRVYLILVKAVTLMLKHATFLRISILPKSALTNVELNYKRANIDETIKQHLKMSASEQSMEQFVHFIMNTDIGLFMFFYLSHQYLIFLVLSQSSAHSL